MAAELERYTEKERKREEQYSEKEDEEGDVLAAARG